MRKITLLMLFIFIISCVSKVKDDPLIVPPNFSSIPDINNPEKPSEKQKKADIEKLKDLLLKSE